MAEDALAAPQAVPDAPDDQAGSDRLLPQRLTQEETAIAPIPSVVDAAVRVDADPSRTIARTLNLTTLLLLLATPIEPAFFGVAFVWWAVSGLGFRIGRMIGNHGVVSIDHAVSALQEDRAGGTMRLVRLLRSRMVPSLKLEVAGRLSFLALEQGDVPEATRFVVEGWSGVAAPLRSRGVGRGLIGELARSVLAWINPQGLIGARVANARALVPRVHRRMRPSRELSERIAEHEALLAGLRSLEATASSDAVLIRSWQACEASELRGRYPGIFSIVQAKVAERIPQVEAEMRARLAEPQHRRERKIVARLFPRWATDEVESIYRGLAPVAPPTDHHEELYAPEEIRALVEGDARRSMHRSLRRIESFRAGSGAYALAILFGSCTLSGAGLAQVGLALFTTGLVLPPLMLRRERWRLRPSKLLQLKPPPPRSWAGELDRSPALRARTEAGAAPVHLFELFAACVRAEQALRESDTDTAWHCVAWWYRGLDPIRLPNANLYAVGGALVRVAALTDHLDEARTLADAMLSWESAWSLHRRTVHGNARQAVALARALVYVRQSEPRRAAWALADAADARQPVVMEPADRVLYTLVAERVRASGHECDWSVRVDAKQRARWRKHWLALCPDLAVPAALPDPQAPNTAQSG